MLATRASLDTSSLSLSSLLTVSPRDACVFFFFYLWGWGRQHVCISPAKHTRLDRHPFLFFMLKHYPHTENTGKLRYANNSEYKNDTMIRKEVGGCGGGCLSGCASVCMCLCLCLCLCVCVCMGHYSSGLIGCWRLQCSALCLRRYLRSSSASLRTARSVQWTCTRTWMAKATSFPYLFSLLYLFGLVWFGLVRPIRSWLDI